jgi:transposase
LVPLLNRIEADESLPVLARELFAIQATEYGQLQAQIDEVDTKDPPRNNGIGVTRTTHE